MLRQNGVLGVRVISVPGRLTDHYDPRSKTVNLSEGVYGKASIAAAAVAAHECGHAVQHAKEYAPVKLRSALVPVISIASRWSIWVIVAGFLLINQFPALFWIGIGMIAASALFALVTLPVEFDASARAMEWLRQSHTLDGKALVQARKALSWAASTYVVAAVGAIATLLYYLSIARGRN
jgi:Zn-dependent membrane protease YugP